MNPLSASEAEQSQFMAGELFRTEHGTLPEPGNVRSAGVLTRSAWIVTTGQKLSTVTVRAKPGQAEAVSSLPDLQVEPLRVRTPAPRFTVPTHIR